MFEPGQTGAGVFGYGYQTWLTGGTTGQFALRGRRGQAIFVDPQSKLVLVQAAAGAEGGGVLRRHRPGRLTWSRLACAAVPYMANISEGLE